MDITCVSGDVTGCYLFVQWWYAKGFFFFFLPSPDEAPPSRLRGSGQKEEVKLRGGVWRLRKGEEPVGSEQRPLGVVQFWEKYKNGSRVFEASERTKERQW